jgi:ribosomal protein S1
MALAAVLVFPAVTFAQTAAPAAKAPAQKAEKAPAAASKKVASHSASGTVKSISDSQLVITTSGKTPKDETFVVNASTAKKPAMIETGAHVSVRYTQEGTTMTATAISAAAPKATKATKAPKK